MGTSQSKRDTIKRNKNHNRQKMFRFDISFGRNDLNLEGHVQMGYNSKTIKNYSSVERQLVLDENLPSTSLESEEITSSPQTGTTDD